MTLPARLSRLVPLAFFGTLFCLSACQEKETATWEEVPPAESSTTTSSTSSAEPASPVTSPDTEKPATQPEKAQVAATAPAADDSLRFLAYNIKNYLSMERTVDGESVSQFKDEKEIAALIKIIVSEKPDILGICEIGTEENLKDFQNRLKEAGLDLPHSEYAHGWDNTRRLALLSRLPITARNSQSELFYETGGSTLQHSRGILDATIDLPGGPTRFIGLHLKSKRELRDHDQELMRQNEALLARKHCNTILEENPSARLLVYGDFNDTRRTPTIYNLLGQHNAANYLEDIYLVDSRGENWTHFWDYQDTYARIDYVLASKALIGEIDRKRSYVVDHPDWATASDHRALLITITP
ncbi:MAG: endonuclease/exonuclease/phosphatase family protein [Verrucomicrobiales bacterium]